MDTSIKEQFRTYLSNCVQTRRQTGKSFLIGRTAVDSYVSFVEADKLFDYAPDEWRDIDSIFDITSSEKILQISEKLFSDERFKAKDSGESSQYYRSNAIKQYYCFLKARELFINTKGDFISKELDYKRLPLQQIFYGAPGTGKSHTVNEITEKQPKENVFRTTFHPDSDYATFVGCYKPTKEATSPLSLHKLHELYPEFKTKVENRPLHRFITKYYNSFRLLTEKEAESVFDKIETSSTVTAEVPKIMAAIEEISTSSTISYSFVPQTFTKAYLRAWQTEDPVYLVIEEINRGNCAQIFGDLFQLLDRKNGFSEYPIKADNDLAAYIGEQLSKESREGILETVKSGEELVLPPNLYIWATMNTSDQSLFPIDSAFKRRWEWKYIKIAWPYKKNEDGTFQTDENGKKIHFNYQIEGSHDWWEFLQKINAIIGNMTNSADKQLGYFFAKAKDDVISYDTFVSKVCFYLWNDIFKTYALDEQQSDLFSYTDNEGKKNQLTFPAFYDGDGNVIKEVAEAFIGNVMRWNSDTKNDKA